MRIDGQREFETRECPSCGVDVPTNNNYCPICSYAFPQLGPRKKHVKRWAGLLMLLLFIILAFRLLRWL